MSETYSRKTNATAGHRDDEVTVNTDRGEIRVQTSVNGKPAWLTLDEATELAQSLNAAILNAAEWSK